MKHLLWPGVARLGNRGRYVHIHTGSAASLKLDRAQWACRGAPDPSAPQAASDFDPTSHADFGTGTHPSVGGGTHRRRATFERC